jgi:hypothetical protein|tara:strand:+ start:131 stop:373 length:243 start_codon:yes stop_codon:yes gene_type:complete
MTPELETYYNNYNELFNHEGFKQLLKDVSNNADRISDIQSVKDLEELFFRKGQIAAFNSIINLEGTIEAGREQVEEESPE